MVQAAERCAGKSACAAEPLIEKTAARRRGSRERARICFLSEVLAWRALWAGVEKKPNPGFGPMAKLFSSEKFLTDSADLLNLTAPYSLSKREGPAGFLNQCYRHAHGTTHLRRHQPDPPQPDRRTQPRTAPQPRLTDDMSEAPHLLTEDDGAILIATLNRPEKLNALSGETMELFEAALHRFRDTPAFKVMLVRANGRYFCAGADLRGGGSRQRPRRRRRRAFASAHRLKLTACIGSMTRWRRSRSRSSSPIMRLAWVAGWSCRCPAIFGSRRRARVMRSRRASSACCLPPTA